AFGIDERQADVERGVQRAIVLVSGPPELAKTSNGQAGHRILGDERAGVRLRQQDRPAGVLQRSDAVQHEAVERDSRPWLAGGREAADAKTGRRKDLNALLVVGRVGNGERAVRRDAKRERVEDPSRLAPDVDDLPGAVAARIHAVDDLAAAVEYEVLTR